MNGSPRRIWIGKLFFAIAIAAQSTLVWALEPTLWTDVPDEFNQADVVLRSPLRSMDGSLVKSPDDWRRRRREIIERWEGHLGVWPPVIERPQIRVLETQARGDITQRRVMIELAPGQSMAGYFLIPAGHGPFPAVFVPYYDPETSVGLGDKGLRDFAWQLARRGFVSLAVGSPGGDARAPVLCADAKCQPLHYLGYLAANAWNGLASLPEVDANRIGIVGHSYGGKWAMFGSCFWERYACAVWSDPGIVFDETRASINYQEPWYLGLDPSISRKPGLVRDENPRTGAYRELVAKGHNLHELHALMAPRPFLVSGGAEDPPKRWGALHHTIAVNQLLGYEGRVAMTNREGHTPTEESNEQIYEFFEYWLKTRPR